MTLLIPFFMALIIGLQMLLVLYQGDKGTRIELITESEYLTDSCKKYLAEQDFIKDGTYIITYDTVPRRSLKSHIDGRKKEILSENLNGVIFVPSTALKNKKIEFYSKTPTNLTIFEKIDNHLNEVLVDHESSSWFGKTRSSGAIQSSTGSGIPSTNCLTKLATFTGPGSVGGRIGSG